MSRRGDFESAIKRYRGTEVNDQRLQHLWEKAAGIQSSKVRININGTEFLLRQSTCLRIPQLRDTITLKSRSRLSRVSRSGRGEAVYSPWTMRSRQCDMELSFERSSTVFAAVVDYVQNQELHAPQMVCPRLFARELQFWGFDVDELEPCCYAGVLRFLYEQDKLVEFHGFLKKKDHSKLKSNMFSTSQSEESGAFQTFKNKMANLLEKPFNTRAARLYFFVTIFSIVGSMMTACAETMVEVNSVANGTSVLDKLTPSFIFLDQLCTALQCMDYVLRALFCPVPKLFLCEPINLTDGLAMIAGIAKMIFPIVFECNPNRFLNQGCHGFLSPYLYIIYLLQLLRFLRILRPMSQIMQFRLLYYTLKSSLSELLLVFMLLLLLAMIFSYMLYYLGSKTSIPSIPTAMWFSLITLTTVGYGDVVPNDWISRILGCCMAVLGVILLTMTTPIMVSNFHSLYINAVVGQPSTIKHLKLDMSGSFDPSPQSQETQKQPDLDYTVMESGFKHSVNPRTPVSSEPLSSEPLSSQPLSSQPLSSQPLSSQPLPSQPLPSQPFSSQPLPSQPLPNQPESIQHVTCEAEKSKCRHMCTVCCSSWKKVSPTQTDQSGDAFNWGLEHSSNIAITKPSFLSVTSPPGSKERVSANKLIIKEEDPDMKLQSTASEYADSESGTDTACDSTDSYKETVFKRHLGMIEPRQRTWSKNYDTDTSENESVDMVQTGDSDAAEQDTDLASHNNGGTRKVLSQADNTQDVRLQPTPPSGQHYLTLPAWKVTQSLALQSDSQSSGSDTSQTTDSVHERRQKHKVSSRPADWKRTARKVSVLKQRQSEDKDTQTVPLVHRRTQNQNLQTVKDQDSTQGTDKNTNASTILSRHHTYAFKAESAHVRTGNSSASVVGEVMHNSRNGSVKKKAGVIHRLKSHSGHVSTSHSKRHKHTFSIHTSWTDMQRCLKTHSSPEIKSKLTFKKKPQVTKLVVSNRNTEDVPCRSKILMPRTSDDELETSNGAKTLWTRKPQR